ncbi:50S ribosomal protein L2 [Patescibacteria group bacterium]|nr:50S ribosomal protein L2 [Patescibacteria group bacterium]MBU4367881.1 50S ribosomal protein L2 [Patescibacteria group bacterium]MBU4461942.1 50S ribosomal protein L2 [Patescibacteria group bacterium]MCG2699885.1 50S ribosomal protein L2 [Candidatus Parcubacteria bacterium]
MKIYKPTTPGRRGMTGIDYSVLTKKEPEKTLLRANKKRMGRAQNGRITTRHKGGGRKRLYRIIEFGQPKLDMVAKVIALEYDPNRTSFIALIQYQDNTKSYILASQGLKVGDEMICSEKSPLKPGNRTKLKNVPVGTMVYNIEMEPGKGGMMVRGAGTTAQVLAQEEGYAQLKMPSTEIRRIKNECFASIGTVSNSEHRFVNIGKAGRSRLMGRRPTVRGSAMNPVDHPHGGGEGRQPIGLKHPKTPWGKPALGVKTRSRKKMSNKFIIKRRIKNK